MNHMTNFGPQLVTLLPVGSRQRIPTDSSGSRDFPKPTDLWVTASYAGWVRSNDQGLIFRLPPDPEAVNLSQATARGRHRSSR
jgi:hypothetical protein